MIQRSIWNQELVLLEKILLRDGVHKIDELVGRLQKFQSEEEERFIKKLVD